MSRRDKENARLRRKSEHERDIAEDYPPRAGADLAGRDACAGDLRLFCERYFPRAFHLPWSPDHLRVLGRMQTAITSGGLFALAMPRGSGKTTLCERAALWALMYGHARFVVLIAATEGMAEKILDRLKSELQHNDDLARDFPHVCYPIRRLENNARRCIGQLFDGRQTRIEWGAKRVVFPTMPDSVCDGRNVSGACVTVSGLTGALRGQSHVLEDGSVVRPDLAIVDDPQTRESSGSPSQCAERLAIITGDVLGMSGPGRTISVLMPCTVCQRGDLADQLLDRRTYPQWHGERTRTVYAWPSATRLWEEYFLRLDEGHRHDRGVDEANAYYAEHREAMDHGAVVAWPERFDTNELSAIQHAMNLRHRLKDEAFFAEYQNDPLAAEDSADLVPVSVLVERVNRIARGVAPLRAETLTAFIDVHDTLLYWAVAAWSGDGSGWLIDYGAYPEQPRRRFSLRKASPTLAGAAPGAGRAGAILAGLSALADRIVGREYDREDGAKLRIARCLIDSGYVPDIVHDYCRRSRHASVLMPSRGFGVGASQRPMSEYTVKPGERHGQHWIIGKLATRAVMSVRFDSHYWKSHVHAMLRQAPGDPGALTWYGTSPEDHRQLAEHLTAEYPVPKKVGGRTVNEWRVRPGMSDNHWLDCVVGCAVAASIHGGASQRQERKSYAQMYEAWRS